MATLIRTLAALLTHRGPLGLIGRSDPRQALAGSRSWQQAIESPRSDETPDQGAAADTRWRRARRTACRSGRTTSRPSRWATGRAGVKSSIGSRRRPAARWRLSTVALVGSLARSEEGRSSVLIRAPVRFSRPSSLLICAASVRSAACASLRSRPGIAARRRANSSNRRCASPRRRSMWTSSWSRSSESLLKVIGGPTCRAADGAGAMRSPVVVSVIAKLGRRAALARVWRLPANGLRRAYVRRLPPASRARRVRSGGLVPRSRRGDPRPRATSAPGDRCHSGNR
jgi:hypothetical protein